MNTIAVIGLGYVGLPLDIEFGKHARTIGFDIATTKVDSCKRGVDPSHELPDEEMQAAVYAQYSSDPKILQEADVIIIAVPTPVDSAHIPDFAPLIGASKSAGANLKKGAIVVYESTVYPGATEEICIPVLEQASGLKWKQDFFIGYSPERIVAEARTVLRGEGKQGRSTHLWDGMAAERIVEVLAKELRN